MSDHKCHNLKAHSSHYEPKTCVIIIIIIQGKGHPITGHEGPEGEQMYSSTLPSTSALDGGGWSTPRPNRFTPRKDPVPIV